MFFLSLNNLLFAFKPFPHNLNFNNAKKDSFWQHCEKRKNLLGLKGGISTLCANAFNLDKRKILLFGKEVILRNDYESYNSLQ